MRMTFDKEVTHVISYRYDCHLINVEDIAESLNAIGHNTLFLINSLAWPYSNSIPIVYSKWLKDSNLEGVLINYRDYLV